MPPKPYYVIDPRKINSGGNYTPSKPLPPKLRKFGYILNTNDLLPGDLILLHALDLPFISKSIIDVQRQGGHAPEDAKWHHVAVYLCDNHICEASITGGVKQTDIFKYIGNHLLRVRRDLSLDLNDRWRIAFNALSQKGKSYSIDYILEIIKQSKIGFWKTRKKRTYSQATVCSQLFSDSYSLVTDKLLVKGNIGIATPADLSLTNVLNDVDIGWSRIM